MLAASLLGVSPLALAVACVVVAIGAAVQGAIGIGLGLVAAPILGVIDHDFLPVSVIVCVIPLGVGVVLHERRHIDWREVGFALAGRLPGVAIGAWLVGALGAKAISVAIGAAVLTAVVGSVTRWRFRASHRNLAIAGFASGITGTAAGIGGPPMALAYQHGDPVNIRATLGGYFLFGSIMSLVALAVGGSVSERDLRLALLLVPSALVGLGLSRLLVRRLPAATIRPLLLVACSVSALVLLIETFA